MSVDFTKLDTILTAIHSIEKIVINQIYKRWLNTQEAANYLGYSEESIKAFVKSGEFIKGEHYHKKRKRLLYDSNKLDNWVISDSTKQEDQINKIIKEIKTNVA